MREVEGILYEISDKLSALTQIVLVGIVVVAAVVCLHIVVGFFQEKK